MELELVVKIVIGLVVFLGILFFLLFSRAKKKKESILKTEHKKIQSFDDLIEIVKNKDTDSKALQVTLDLIIQEYGKINNIDKYLDVMLIITQHKNTNKNIIISFDKKLSDLNPEYKKQISSALREGLNAR